MIASAIVVINKNDSKSDNYNNYDENNTDRAGRNDDNDNARIR